METKEEILNQVRIKYNKSLSDKETLETLKKNHDELIISPDECYLAMERYAEQKLNIHSVGGPASASVSEGEQLGNEGQEKSVCVDFRCRWCEKEVTVLNEPCPRCHNYP